MRRRDPRTARAWPAALLALALLLGAPARCAAQVLLQPDPQLAALPQAPRLDSGHAYTLPELVDLAESHNPDTRIAWDAARQAQARAGVARRAYLPRLGALFLGGAQDNTTRLPVAGTSIGTRNTGSGVVSALTLQWLVFDFGERAAVARAAGADAAAADVAVTAADQQLIFDVCATAYAHAAASARLDNVRRTLAASESIAAAARARLARGVGNTVDAALAAADVAQARYALVRADAAVRKTRLELLGAIGISPLSQLRVAPIAARPLPADVALPLRPLLRQALARRTDLRVADDARRAARARLRAARAAYRPKIFAAAQVAVGEGGGDLALLPPAGPTPPALGILGRGWGGAVELGVAVPLFDGGMRAAAQSQARADVDRADAAFTRVRDDAVRQIVVADTDLHTSLAAAAAADAERSASRVAWNAAAAAYARGVGTLQAVDSARIRLLAARDAASDAYFAARTAALRMALAAGRLGAAP